MASVINANTSGGLISTGDTSGVLQLQTGGTAAVTIDGSQNVGVGTASPTQKLHVVGATTTNPSILLAETSGSSLQLISSATNSFIGTNGATPLRLGTNFTEQMRLDSSGNLGLGVTPSASSACVNMELSSYGATISARNNASAPQIAIMSNAVGNWYAPTYKINAKAAMYLAQGNDGTHSWFTAGTGTAGNPITFTQAMTLDASGRLGIGKTNPTTPLWISSSGTEVVIEDNDTGKASSPNAFLGFYGSDGRAGYVGFPSDSNLYLNNQNSAALLFLTANTERARIDNSGAFLMGKTSTDDTTQGFAYRTSGYISVVRSGGAPAYFNRLTSTGAVVEIAYASSTVGTISTNGSSTAYNTTSDYRLKEDVQPMVGALERVAQLKPVTYKWKATGEAAEGFIAHELQAVVPDCVVGEKDATKIEEYEISAAVPATYDEEGNELTPAVEAVMGEREVPVYQGIDTSFLVATLTAAIQEQQTLITQLTERISALEGAK